MCKITIIVPIYNVEKYLRECLDSLLNQTFKDIEILCMNDGSTDGSVQILEEYKNKDKRIRVINKKNSGYGATMNMGIDAANSEYIGILESDDVAKPEMFENLYNLITKYNCDVVKSDFFLYYSKQNKLIKNNIMQGKIINKVTNIDEDIEILGICPSIWSCLYKKDFLLKNNIRFLETPGASYQDTSFYQKVILSAKKVFLTDNAYVQYRVDNENSSVNNRGKIYCITDEYKEIHKYIDKKAELKKYEQYIYMLQFNAYQWNIDRLAKNFKKEFFDYYYKEFCFLKDKGLLTNEFFSRAYYIDFDLFFNKPDKYYKKYVQPCKMKPIFEKIFSVTNSNCHKVVTILGMKFKFKNKYKELKSEIGNLNQRLSEAYNIIHDRAIYKDEMQKMEFETANWVWRTYGPSDELFARLEYLAQSPYQWNVQDSKIWLVYISCLLEKGKKEQALNALVKYASKYQYKDIERYLLVAQFAYMNNLRNEEIDKANFVYQKLEENRKNNVLAKLLENKTIAIVGNGPSEIGKSNGKEIDSHDIVIRFNNYRTDGFEADYGSKTDIWARGSGGNDVIDREQKYQLVTWEADYSHWRVLYDYLDIMYRQVKGGQLIYNFDYDCHLSLRNASGIDFPTTGLVLIWDIYQKLGSLDNVDFYGFSFCQDMPDRYATHYFNDRTKEEAIMRSEVHRIDKEAEFLKRLIG